MRHALFPLSRVSRCVLLAAGALAGATGGAADALIATPLAPRTVPSGATLFASVAPEQSGVVTENKFADPRMWTDRYQEIVYGAIGTGVAIGDYDGDGRPDLFVVSKTERSRLFRNLGHWKFEDVTDRAGLPGRDSGGGISGAVKGLLGSGATADPVDVWKQGATFADINNDGRLDLYVCRFGGANWLFVNQGDGTFKEEAAARGLALSDASGTAAFCDYDRDGWLDVYVQTNLLDAAKRPQGQPDRLYRNRGDGTFEEVTAAAGIKGDTQGHSATWWDFDDDGWPDLYVANDFAVPDSLYRNQRDGTFADALGSTVPHTPHSSMGADLGDVNNDGRIDFYVADMATTTHEKDQRGMARIRGLLNASDYDAVPAPQFMRNALYVATGTGRYLEAAQFAGIAATDWTWSVRFEDLDNDGRLDLHVTNGMNREYHNNDMLQRIIGIESFAESRRLIRESPVMAERNLAYRNRGELQFEETGAKWGLDQLGVSFGVAFGDLDGDGDLDLAMSNYEAPLTLLRNESNTGHRLIVALRGTRSNKFGVGATVRIATASGAQVRTLVTSRGYLSSSEPVLHFGLGDDTAIQRLTVEWPSGEVQTFTDLPVDQRLTITEPPGGHSLALAATKETASASARGETTAGAREVKVSLFADVTAVRALAIEAREGPFAEGRPQPLIPTRFSRRGPALAAGDLDGDGFDELVLGGTITTPAKLLRAGSATTAFAEIPLGAAGPLPDGPVLVFDADGDARADLFFTRAGVARPNGAAEYQPRLLLNAGADGLRAVAADALPAYTSSVGAAVAADFDRDGKLDLFLGGRVIPGRYPLAPRSALWRNTGGKFEDVTDALAPVLREVGLVTSALWSDVDADGWIDLLVSLEWGGVKFFRNDSGRGFVDRSEAAGFASAGTGWWTALATADFNGDGRLDYAAGNVGLNTPYRASTAEPSLLYHGDFGGNAGPVLLEGYHENGRLLARRSRKDLGAAIPAVLKKYPKNDDFARATLAEIVGEARLNNARKFAATEFRSGLFLSQPDGTFRFVALPRLAQLAPVQGLQAGDFDGDGRADLYAVQNSYAPFAEVGRFDGGISQLLRGDGRGGFEPVESWRSGLIVPGDAKALVVTDLNSDGAPDFVVANNNAPLLAFQNRAAAAPGGKPTTRFVRVTLRGAAGNPTAIGAVVTAELADGSTQTAQISAGGGYWSQSSAACFFGIPAGAAPKRLQVRWPDGAAAQYPWPANSDSNVTLSRE